MSVSAAPLLDRVEGVVSARPPIRASPRLLHSGTTKRQAPRHDQPRTAPRPRSPPPGSRPRCRIPCLATTSGRFASRALRRSVRASACSCRRVRLGYRARAASSACATAKPSRARSSGAPRNVRVATSSSRVASGVAMKSGPFRSCTALRTAASCHRGMCSFVGDLHGLSGARTAGGSGRAAAQYWSRPRRG